ncbi:MAG: polymer-forming cytoskeletal protein [candidate division Zixibacteria bacterium]|nr:polymer-forming cytoskeletal protein [candidate division Zixibacteria bacterium]
MKESSWVTGAIFIAGLSCLACLIVTSSRADSLEGSRHSPDTLFNEIHLADEGVFAVDTAGYEWYYDFDAGTFVKGKLEDEIRGKGTDRIGRIELNNLPLRERCAEEQKVKPFERKPVTIGYDEFVDGDIRALGRVTIKGWVKGNVTSLSKRVLVTESGQVDGNIEAPEVVVKSGGKVLGKVIEDESPLEFRDLQTSFSPSGLIVVASIAVFLLFLGFLVISLMPRQMDSFYNCFASYKVRTFLLGILFLILMPVILVLVIITIVGLVVVPFVPVLYLAAFVLGMISFGNMIGKALSRRFTGGGKSVMFQSAIGILVLMSFWFLTAVGLGASDPVSEGFGILFLVISIIITSFPLASGVGAAILTRFGFREYVSFKDHIETDYEPPATAPAPPPIPNHPSPDKPPGP